MSAPVETRHPERHTCISPCTCSATTNGGGRGRRSIPISSSINNGTRSAERPRAPSQCFRITRRLPRLGLLAAVCSGALVVAAQRPTAIASDIAIQLLAVNDFHGHLEPPSGENGLVHR